LTNQPEGRASAGFFEELKRRKVVRVAVTYALVAWLVIQIADAVFPNLLIPDWALRLVIVSVLLGFPIALILAWAFELTPDGIKTNRRAVVENPQADYSSKEIRKRNLYAVAGAALLPTLIFGSLAAYYYFKAPAANDSIAEIERSIAVLPFDNRSNLEEDEFFTDGIHDDLLTQISRIKGVKTISRTSVMGYKDTEKNMRQIGEELGVAHLLEGGVQRAGKQVRINMQLIDANTDGHIWAETYTRELTAENIFDIQSEITLAIAAELQSLLSEEEQQRIEHPPTENLEALEFYFKGLTGDVSTHGLELAIQNFTNAIERDPDFALAHARLAHAYHSQIWFAGLQSETQIRKATPHLERAFELEPNLAEAWLVKGLIVRNRNQFDEAEQAFEKAIELDPNNDSALFNNSLLLFWDRAKPEPALDLIEKAIEISPATAEYKMHKADILAGQGRQSEAIATWKNINSQFPDSSNVQSRVGKYFIGQGLFDQAIKALRKAHFLDKENPNAINGIPSVYHQLGDIDEVKFWLERGLTIFPQGQYSVSYKMGLLLINGELEQAHALWVDAYNNGGFSFSEQNNGLIYVLHFLELENGIYANTLQRFELMTPEFFEDEFEIPNTPWRIDFQGLNTLVLIGHAMKLKGDDAEAEKLLEIFIDETENTDGFHLDKASALALLANRATALALLGETEKAKAILIKVFNEDEARFWKIEGSIFPRILDQEYVENLNQAADARRKEMLDNIAAMEARGELAPLPEVTGSE
jgi:TolB-like protein/Flp pilus assembly protein TadD